MSSNGYITAKTLPSTMSSSKFHETNTLSAMSIQFVFTLYCFLDEILEFSFRIRISFISQSSLNPFFYDTFISSNSSISQQFCKRDYESSVKRFAILELFFQNSSEPRNFFQYVIISFGGHKKGTPIGGVIGARGVRVYYRGGSGQANH